MEILAFVAFVPAEKGGRLRPPASGYRSTVWFGSTADDGEETLRDFEFDFPGSGGDDTIVFDREVAVVMRPVDGDDLDGVLAVAGQRFEVREGFRTVGVGHVR
ncbi:hypothetical protein [Patulibacter defluvii]|uniref:hypothetical protein n=1 Tax=Patulibacter defluvii TaxID=3095358 RepID=UPI002A762919|nr:hypothetical protein [Patulibacter sp. DM4]